MDSYDESAQIGSKDSFERLQENSGFAGAKAVALKSFLFLYKGLIGPFMRAISGPGVGQCRFVPSCSEYCKECFEELSLWEALFRSGKRVLSCHPWNQSDSFDPVKFVELRTE